MIISEPLFLNIFWQVFLIYSDCGLFRLLSGLICHLWLVQYCFGYIWYQVNLTEINWYIKIPQPLKWLLCFLINGSPTLYKIDFLAWTIVSLSLAFIVTSCFANIEASQLVKLLWWRGRSPLCQTLEICLSFCFQFFRTN